MAVATLFDEVARERSIQESFLAFHRDNPEIFALFHRFAEELRRAGRKRYSADAIIQRIRWHMAVEVVSEDDFKINDHYSSRYARMLIDVYREFDGFFNLRRLREPKGDDDGKEEK